MYSYLYKCYSKLSSGQLLDELRHCTVLSNMYDADTFTAVTIQKRIDTISIIIEERGI